MAIPRRRLAAIGGLSAWLLANPGGDTRLMAQESPDPTTDPREGMLLVPAGEFLQGSPDDDTQAQKNEMPQRVVFLPAFYIDQFEVTNIEYKRFVDATGYPAPPHWIEGFYAEGADFYPIVEVTWWDAMAYARWVGKRLPTEAEWEKAARGTDGRRFPWGDEYNSHLANAERRFMPVNAHLEGASPCGAVNMAGNAAEWTASVYEPYPELVPVLPAEFGGTQPSSTAARPKTEKLEPRGMTPAAGAASEEAPEPPEGSTTADSEEAVDAFPDREDPRAEFLTAGELQDTRPRVYRGGAINTYPRFLRCANRQKESPNARWYNLGFRCAMDAEPGVPGEARQER